MKKPINVLLCLIILLVMTGCRNKNSISVKPGNQPASVDDVLQQGIEEEDSKNKDVSTPPQTVSSTDRTNTDTKKTPAETSTRENYYQNIDIDLTVLSSTMVYSQVYDIMVAPDLYFGKVIKMEGTCARYYDKVTDNHYFACVIQDATACCSTGIEFVLADHYKSPDDYPEVNAKICLIGVFDSFMDGDYLFCALRDAVIVN